MDTTPPTPTAAAAAATAAAAAAASSSTDPGTAPLQRSVSQHSSTSLRSHRSRRTGAAPSRSRKRASLTSSCASSVAASDKSLTSFPSFSPGSPTGEEEESDVAIGDEGGEGGEGEGGPPPAVEETRSSSWAGRLLQGIRGDASASPSPAQTSTKRKSQSQNGMETTSPPNSPPLPPPPTTESSTAARDALFDDSPLLSSHNIPGALHRADDAHIERLVARHGAVGLARLLAEDLARRDAQMSALRRRSEARERALRKIILECGLSNLDLEMRLRAVESTMARTRRDPADGAISDLVSDAMDEEVGSGEWFVEPNELEAATISARGTSASADPAKGGGMRAWKDFFWAKATGSRASSVSGDASRYPTVVRAPSAADKCPGLGDDLFSPPAEQDPIRPNNPPSRSPRLAPSVSNSLTGRKSSLAAMALRLVAGGAISSKESEARSRAGSGASGPADADGGRSVDNGVAPRSGRTASQGRPKALAAVRGRNNVTAARPVTNNDRWDAMTGSPPRSSGAGADGPPSRQESYGPVEMDTILPVDAQPPTMARTQSNRNYCYNYPNGEFLTDRFGFIYDQRRKKRQREATAEMASRTKQAAAGARTEMLMSNVWPGETLGESSSLRSNASPGDRPGSPDSREDAGRADGTASRSTSRSRSSSRWQDYLRIATYPTIHPTELLSHTPGATSSQALEVDGSAETPASLSASASAVAPSERGLLPSASSTTSAVDSVAVSANSDPRPDPENAGSPLPKEDMEPVRLLLQQLGDVHDALQRDRTVRWNDFLRKVRAERRRQGEAEAAAAAAAAEARFEQPALILPEARFHDGEMIGIADLGNKGKAGRVKWTEFKTLVLAGIPVAYRPKVWAECSGAVTLRVPGLYDELVSRRPETNGSRPPTDDDAADDPACDGSGSLSRSTALQQIEMDIRRTLTDNIFFRKGPGVEKLREVLVAYSRRNPDVGYCQGMNMIAANLLLVMPSAEDAFWVLTSIIEHILPAGYYDDSLLTSRADQRVLCSYAATVLPRLWRHLDALGIELEALTFQWFLSVFTDLLSAEALFRVWDVVLCAGPDCGGATFLFRVALALLKLNEPQLLRCDSPAAAYTYINHHMTNHAISIDGLIQAGEALRRVVKRGEVEARREAAVAQEKDVASRRRMDDVRRGRGASVGSGSAADESVAELVVRDPVPMQEGE